MSTWIKGKLPYVEYRIDKNRPKVGVNFDRYYRVRFKALGKTHVIVLGHWSANWTEQEAYNKAEKYKANIKSGQHPQNWKEEQEMQRAEAEAEKRRKEQEAINNITFADFWDTYKELQHGKEMRNEQSQYENWLKPVLGDLALRQIKPFHIEKVKKNLLDAGRSPRTVQYCFATFRQVWNTARIRDLVIGDSPTRKVKLPKFDNKRVRFLTQSEADQLLDELKLRSQQLHDIALLSLHTGMRAGEIYKLRWSDVDLDNETITLRGDNTKSSKTRYAYLTQATRSMLKSHYTGQASNEFVFLSRNGSQITEVSDAFERAVNKIGLNAHVSDRRQKVTFHTLRHTFASWLVQEGTDLYVVKELLGHHSIQLTERYSHLQPDGPKRAVKLFDQKRNKEQAQEKEQGKVINMQQGQAES